MISYYELIGLVKENKHPKEIKYQGEVYHWDGYDYAPEHYGDEELKTLIFECNYFKPLIEIIEEPKEIQTISKYYTYDEEDYFDIDNYNHNMREQVKIANQQSQKIDELVKAVNELKRGA